MLRTYALAPETVRRFMRRIFWRFQLISTLSFLFFGLYLAFFSGPVRWERAGPIVVLISLAYFFIIFFNFRTQLRNLYSLRYEIRGSLIVSRQFDRDPQQISRADISSVFVRNDSLLIETIDGETMQIPYGLAREGDKDFRETLGAWVGVVPPEARPRSSVRRLLFFGILGAILVMLFANSLVVLVPMLLVTLIYGVYTERRLTRATDAGPGVVRMYNMAFSFLIFVLVMKSCMIGMTMALVR